MSKNLYGAFFKNTPLTYLDLSVKERTIANVIQQMEGAFDTMGNMVGNIHGKSSQSLPMSSYVNTLHSLIGAAGMISPEEPFGESMTGYIEQFPRVIGQKEFLLTLKPIISTAQQLTTPISIQSDDPDEKNVVWVYKSQLKDLKKDTDFAIIGRRLVFYRTIQGNLQVQYDGSYPTFGRSEAGYRPNVIPSPELIDLGKVKKPVLTRLPNGRIRVKVQTADYNRFADKKFGKQLSPRFQATLRAYVGPTSTTAISTSEDVIAPWIRRQGKKTFEKLPVSNVYVISELEYEIEALEEVDLANDTIVMSVSNVTISEMIRDLYHFMRNHSHSSFDSSRPISHSELQSMIPQQENDQIRYSPSVIPGNDHPQYIHREGYRAGDPGTYNNAMIGDLFIASKYNGDGEDNGQFHSNLDGDSFSLIFGDANAGQKLFRKKQTQALCLSQQASGLEIITPGLLQVGKNGFALKLDNSELYSYRQSTSSSPKLVIQSQSNITRFQQPIPDYTVGGLGDIEVRNIYISGSIIPLTQGVQIGQPNNRIAAIFTNELTAGKETVGTPGIPGVATVYTQPITVASWQLVAQSDPDVQVRGYYSLRVLKQSHKAGDFPQVVGHYVNTSGQREQFVFHKVVSLVKDVATGAEDGDLIIYSSTPVSGYIKVF